MVIFGRISVVASQSPGLRRGLVKYITVRTSTRKQLGRLYNAETSSSGRGLRRASPCVKAGDSSYPLSPKEVILACVKKPRSPRISFGSLMRAMQEVSHT